VLPRHWCALTTCTRHRSCRAHLHLSSLRVCQGARDHLGIRCGRCGVEGLQLHCLELGHGVVAGGVCCVFVARVRHALVCECACAWGLCVGVEDGSGWLGGYHTNALTGRSPFEWSDESLAAAVARTLHQSPPNPPPVSTESTLHALILPHSPPTQRTGSLTPSDPGGHTPGGQIKCSPQQPHNSSPSRRWGAPTPSRDPPSCMPGRSW
jgi:hypothetical protein